MSYICKEVTLSFHPSLSSLGSDTRTDLGRAESFRTRLCGEDRDFAQIERPLPIHISGREGPLAYPLRGRVWKIGEGRGASAVSFQGQTGVREFGTPSSPRKVFSFYQNYGVLFECMCLYVFVFSIASRRRLLGVRGSRGLFGLRGPPSNATGLRWSDGLRESRAPETRRSVGPSRTGSEAPAGDEVEEGRPPGSRVFRCYRHEVPKYRESWPNSVV